MATWPATLPPVPLNAGYGIQPLDQTLRTDMEVGSPRTRRRTRARLDKTPVSWLMTDGQLHILRDWFDDDATGIAGGSAWFTVVLAVGGAALLETVEARFSGPYKADRDGLHWRVTATLEVR